MNGSVVRIKTAQEQTDKLYELTTLSEQDWRHRTGRTKDSRDWRYATAKADAIAHAADPVLACYRPFDDRYTAYTGNSRGLYSSPQRNVMDHFVKGDNMALSASAILSDLKNEIQPMLSSVTYETWFEPLRAITVEDDKVLILETSTPLAESIIPRRYKQQVEQILREKGYPSKFKVFQNGTYTPQAAQQVEKELVRVNLSKKANLNPRYTFENFVRGNTNTIMCWSMIPRKRFSMFLPKPLPTSWWTPSRTTTPMPSTTNTATLTSC